MHTTAIDFETYYDSKVSLKTLGTYHYLHHPQTEIYLVSLRSNNGVSFCGRPEEAPWDKLHGKRWVAHNYSFDGAVIDVLRERGVIPEAVQPADWNCTANLAVYFSGGRALDKAAPALLGGSVSKDIRKWLRGKTWTDICAAGKAEEVMAYSARDTDLCLGIWEKLGHTWPEIEQWLSQHTIEMGWRGVHANVKLLDGALDKLRKIKCEAQNSLPWWDDDEVANSLPRLYKACRDVGIEPPASTAEEDPRCIEWEAAHLDIPWVKSMRDWRKSNFLLTKLAKIADRVREDGTVPFALKYGGAHTLRWSGDGGFNVQNQNKEAIFGIDARQIFIPAPGYQFAIVDLEQIEPRVLAWLTKDEDFLKLCKTMSPYEAHARLYMGWTGGSLKKESPPQYALAKARVLALGYGAGWEKFIYMCGTYGMVPEEVFSDPVSDFEKDAFIEALGRNKKHLDKIGTFHGLPEAKQRIWVNAWAQVIDFREKSPNITGFWRHLGADFETACRRGGTYRYTLPSGRELSYFDISTIGNETTGKTEIGGDSERFYGGKLCENVVQAAARDVFALGVMRVETGGYPIRFHVHDEIIAEVPLDQSIQPVIDLMSKTPKWLKGCPVSASGHAALAYVK